jgi:hypothetical protein
MRNALQMSTGRYRCGRINCRVLSLGRNGRLETAGAATYSNLKVGFYGDIDCPTHSDLLDVGLLVEGIRPAMA